MSMVEGREKLELTGTEQKNGDAELLPDSRRVKPRARFFTELSEPDDHSWLDRLGGDVNNRRTSLTTLLPFLLADLSGLAICGLLTQAILNLIHLPAADLITFWAAPFVLMPLCLAFASGGLYSEIWVHPVVEFRHITCLTLTAMLAGAFAGLIAWPLPVWCLTALLVTVVVAPLPRMLVRQVLVRFPAWGFPTLVIGTGEGAVDVARLLLEVPRSGLRPVLLSDPSGQCGSGIWPVVNDPTILRSLLHVRGVKHAVVALPEYSMEAMARILDRYSGIVPHLLVLTDISTLPTLWGASRQGGRISGFEVRNSLLLSTLLKVKRVIDVLVAATGLILSFPLLLCIYLAVRLDSPGAALFGHERIGRNGVRFKAWKFRTMYSNSSDLLRAHLLNDPAAAAEWARDQKLKDDPRVTRIGRILRGSSLDELPQLWNVLLGNMSLVGPRPIVESEVERYANAYKHYCRVKPGITGLWQVSGRSSVSYDDRVELDVFYVRHWSLWLDVYILGKTIYTLLSRDGAY